MPIVKDNMALIAKSYVLPSDAKIGWQNVAHCGVENRSSYHVLRDSPIRRMRAELGIRFTGIRQATTKPFHCVRLSPIHIHEGNVPSLQRHMFPCPGLQFQRGGGTGERQG